MLIKVASSQGDAIFDEHFFNRRRFDYGPIHNFFRHVPNPAGRGIPATDHPLDQGTNFSE